MIKRELSNDIPLIEPASSPTVTKIMLDKTFGSSDTVCFTYIECWDGTEENLISVIDSGSQADVLPHVSHWFEGSWSRCRALFLFFSPFFFLFLLAGKSPYNHFFVEPPSPPLPIGIFVCLCSLPIIPLSSSCSGTVGDLTHIHAQAEGCQSLMSQACVHLARVRVRDVSGASLSLVSG